MGDTNQDRLTHAENTLGCETINITEHEVIRDQIAEILKVPEVDSAIDAIGFEAHGHGHAAHKDNPVDALDTIIEVSRYGGHLGIPGVYMPIDPRSATVMGKIGRPAFEFGRAWDKGLSFSTGQAPVMRYNRQLMNAILFNRVRLSRVLNTTPITLEEAPQAYQEFEKGVAKKFVFDTQGVLAQQLLPSKREYSTSNI